MSKLQKYGAIFLGSLLFLTIIFCTITNYTCQSAKDVALENVAEKGERSASEGI